VDLLEVVWNFEPRVVPTWKLPAWYGIMWALGFIVGYQILKKMYASEKMPEELLDKSFIYVLLGGIIGARLGHIIFYDLSDYLANPIAIFKIWEGGLASHGGALGIIIASMLLARKYTEINFVWLLDRFVVPTALAAFLIRIGNLFNHEIVGKITGNDTGFKFLRHDIPEQFAMNQTNSSYPGEAYDKIASDPNFAYLLNQVPNRHPAQLYEGLCYLVIFGVLMWLYWRTNAFKIRGFLLGAFFILLFGVRFFIEFIKENQTEVFTERGADGMIQNAEGLNMGQYLSIPLVCIGLFLVFRKFKEFKVGKTK